MLLRAVISRRIIQGQVPIFPCHRQYSQTQREPASESYGDDLRSPEPDSHPYDGVRTKIDWMGAREEKEIDWINIADVPDTDLPDIPPQNLLKKERDFLKQTFSQEPHYDPDDPYDLKSRSPEEIANHEALAAEDIDEEEKQPHSVKLKFAPLPETPYPPELSPEIGTLRRERYITDFDFHWDQGNPELQWESFLEMRQNGYIPPQKMYSAMIAYSVIWVDHDALEILIEEMAKLKYTHDQYVHTALIDWAILRQDRELMEKRWQDLLDAKFEPTNLLACHKLLFYGKYCQDWEACLNWFLEMNKLGFKDTMGGNTILSIIVANELSAETAEFVFAEMEKHGLLEIDPKTHTIESEFDGETYKFLPRATGVQIAYTMLAQAVGIHGHLDRVDHCFKTCQNIYAKYLWGPHLPKLFIHEQVIYENLIRMYMRLKLTQKGLEILDFMIANKMIPSLQIFREFYSYVCSVDDPQALKSVQLEYETFTFEYNQQMLVAQLKMYSRVRDYRKLIISWNQLLYTGYAPDAECIGCVIEAYEAAGAVDDVQKFYDQQVLACSKVTRKFHEVMLRDYLRRGFPGSAKIVARRMKEEGYPATHEEMTAIFKRYGELGGANQIVSLIETEMRGKNATYVFDPEALASLLEAQTLGEVNRDTAEKTRDTWTKYSPEVILTPPTAARIISVFGKLREKDVALEVYTKLKRDHVLNENDGSEVFVAVFSIPPTAGQTITERLKVFMEMEKASVIPSIEVFHAAMKLCIAYGSPTGALRVMKDFVQEYYGMPFQRKLCTLFLAAMVRFDSGENRELCRTWLNRIVPYNDKPGVTFIPGNRLDISLDDWEETFLSTPQSLSFGKFVASIEFDRVASTETPKDKFSDLYEGADVDVEDLLIHHEGYKPDAVFEAFGEDPEYLRTKELLDAVAKQKKRLQEKENVGMKASTPGWSAEPEHEHDDITRIE